jgi:hypothetical protein
MEFDHLGLITNENKGRDMYVKKTKVWCTDYDKHPYRVEWLKFDPDSPVTGPLREKPHIAFRVDNLEEASKGLKVILEPFFPVPDMYPDLKVAFFETEDGVIVELMEGTWEGVPKK